MEPAGAPVTTSALRSSPAEVTGSVAAIARSAAAVAGAAAQTVLCVLATAPAALLFGDFFHGREYLAPLLLASVAGGVTAAVAARRSWGWVIAGHLVGFAVLASVVLYHGRTRYGLPGPALGAALSDGVSRGWGRMLSVNLPADPLPELLLIPLLLCWTSALGAVTAAARARVPLAPCAPPLAAYVIGLVLTAGRQQQPHLGSTVLLVVVLSVLVRLRVISLLPTSATALVSGAQSATGPTGPKPAAGSRDSGPGTARASDVLVLTSLIAVMSVVAITGTAMVPLASDRRFDLRAVDPPPVAVQPMVTPLSQIKSQLQQKPARLLFRLRLDAPGVRIDRIRVAALDRYDGSTWTSSARFLVAGRALADPPPEPGTLVAIGVVLDKWSSPLLPTVGQPTGLGGTDVSGARAGFDAAGGMLAWIGPRDAGTNYTLTAVVSRTDDLAAAEPMVPVTDPMAASAPEEIPPALRDLALDLTAGSQAPYRRLQRLESFLRSRPYSLDAPPGHSFDALVGVTTAEQPPAALGYAEQHAAAFAVMARAAGFPARVSVGYLLPPASAGAIHNVTTSNAHAWPEVYFRGHGWVAFEPTDTTKVPPEADVAPPPQAVAPPVPPAQSGTQVSLGQPPPTSKPPPTSNPPLVQAARRSIVVLALMLLLLVLALAATAAAKALRRRLRRRGPPAARLLGAWTQALDDLTERSFRARTDLPFVISPASTEREIVRAAETSFGPVTAPLGPLATAVAAYRAGGVLPSEDASFDAWRTVTSVRSELDGGRGGWIRRLRAAVDPRSFWRGYLMKQRGRRTLRRLGWGTA